MVVLNFTGKYDSPTIEEFIQRKKFTYGTLWKVLVWLGFKDEATKWWVSLDNKQLTKISDAEFERVLLDKLSRARKKENETRKGFFLLVSPYCRFMD